jgi:hypothetical protein
VDILYYYGDKNKDDDVGEVCSTIEENEAFGRNP